MKQWMTDPVVLTCAGIIVVGIFGLFWAIGKLRRLPATSSSFPPADSFLPPSPDLRDIDFRAPTLTSPMASPAASSVSKDVASRLDTMSQRLAEMQTVLQKQSAGGASPATGGGAMGQGFSPETIDKLLKIIGNVIQQVDILQKNVDPGKQ